MSPFRAAEQREAALTSFSIPLGLWFRGEDRAALASVRAAGGRGRLCSVQLPPRLSSLPPSRLRFWKLPGNPMWPPPQRGRKRAKLNP